jgi:hypothetical protein
MCLFLFLFRFLSLSSFCHISSHILSLAKHSLYVPSGSPSLTHFNAIFPFLFCHFHLSIDSEEDNKRKRKRKRKRKWDHSGKRSSGAGRRAGLILLVDLIPFFNMQDCTFQFKIVTMLHHLQVTNSSSSSCCCCCSSSSFSSSSCSRSSSSLLSSPLC